MEFQTFFTYLGDDLRVKRNANNMNVNVKGLVASLVVRDLRSETKGSRFESSCYICAEVSSLQ